ncbi:MAG: preprotein translocase subunit SecE [Lachnospiraceae bacterium]|nr:preprotein translocase subunit SecE [Lachnospiraceae bacterium]
MSNQKSNAVKASEGSRSGFFKSVKAQFRRIIWPKRQDVVSETVVVLVISVILGIIIALLDRGLLSFVDLLIGI